MDLQQQDNQTTSLIAEIGNSIDAALQAAEALEEIEAETVDADALGAIDDLEIVLGVARRRLLPEVQRLIG